VTTPSSQPSTQRCGHVVIVGRPNTGKSTLLNTLVGQKISITSRKPQTTRQHLLGINNTADAQILYTDTPGVQSASGDAMSRHMNREALNTLADVDVVIFVIEALNWTSMDEVVISHLSNLDNPTIILAINKVDRTANKADLFPFIEQMKNKLAFAEIIPICARVKKDVDRLQQAIINYLPHRAPEYPRDQITNRSSRYLAAEFMREKLMEHLGDEIPYKLAVTIDRFKEEGKNIHIDATIWVEKEGQKKIIIGKDGAMLKRTGQLARKEMQQLFGQKVCLKTWVKVRRKWTDDETALRRLILE